MANTYSVVKRSTTISKSLDTQIEKIKKFPRWKGSRSAVYEAALEELVLTDKLSVCIFCEVTDNRTDFCGWEVLNRKKGKGVCKDCFKNRGEECQTKEQKKRKKN